MPIEIRELIIRAVVSPDNQDQAIQRGQNNFPDKEKIIAECVEQVMELLKKKTER